MGNDIFTFLPIIVMFGLFYFMLIRPQKKAAEQKRQMIEAMQAGDGVVTIGGLHGIVDEVNQQDGLVVLDCEGVYLTFELASIAKVLKSAGPKEENQRERVEGSNKDYSTEEDNQALEGELETEGNL